MAVMDAPAEQVRDAAWGAWQSYKQMRTHLTRVINRFVTERTGLSEADYEILSVLSGSEDLTMRSLALRADLNWEKSRLSHQLRRMYERGLVARDACEEDARSSVIRLTEKGEEAIALARPLYEEAVATCFAAAMSDEDAEVLSKIAARVVELPEQPVDIDPTRS